MSSTNQAKSRRNLNTILAGAGLALASYAAIPSVKEAIDKINPFKDDETDGTPDASDDTETGTESGV